MKKIAILTITMLCIATLLLGCSNLDMANNKDYTEQDELDYGAGLEIENGVDLDPSTNDADPSINEPNPSPNPNTNEPSDPDPNTGQSPAIPDAVMSTSDDYEVQSLVNLNVRDNPTTDSNVVGVITQSQTLPFIKTLSSWHMVMYKDSVAYVSANSNYSRLKPLVEDADIIENVIAVGLSVLGTPYEFGSTRIIDYNFKPIKAFTGNTFDCSAFVQYAFYKGANISLYGDSRTMSKQGSTVKYQDVKRGDVIFMTSTARQYNTGIEKIGHVGIYLGNNKLLHTYGTGGVRITDFNSFWRGRFISAKCML